jgi:large subunit ribosomal protein L29
MKAAKWRDLSDDELTQKARELSEEIFNLRFQFAMGVAKNPSRLGQARRDLARAYTIRRERGGGPLALAPAPTAAVAAPVLEAPGEKKPAAKAKAAAKPAKAAAASKKAAKAPKAAAKKKSAKG